jgi:predicted metal-dependent hydrolase
VTAAPDTTNPAATTFHKPRVIRRTAASFPVRKIGNDYRDDVGSNQLIAGNPLMSNMLCGISMFFPPGERFMIAAARAVADEIADPRLAQDIDAFVRQEGQHAAEHGRANRFLAGSLGLNAEAVVREIVGLWNVIESRCTPRQRAAVTAATEHFTAIISEVLLADVDFVEAIPFSKALQMLIWHAIEECEHKAVMFDAYQELGGSEWERIAVMALYTPPGFLAAMCPILRLIVANGELTNLTGWVRGIRMLLGWTPALLSRYFRYYRPGFHPNHLPTRHLELFWRHRLGVVDDGKRTA